MGRVDDFLPWADGRDMSCQFFLKGELVFQEGFHIPQNLPSYQYTKYERAAMEANKDIREWLKRVKDE